MNMKNSISMFILGMGTVILYQQIRNGNVRNFVRDMNKAKTEMLEDIEDMM